MDRSDAELDAFGMPPDDATADSLDDEEVTLHRLDAIDLRSLSLVAGLFYLTAFLVLALAIAAVWLGAASLGLISQLEDFMRSIGFRGFRLVGPEVVFGFVLLMAALVVFLTVMTLIAGAFYNLLGTGNRGIRIRTTVLRRERRARDAGEPDESLVAAPLVLESPSDVEGNGEADESPDGPPDAPPEPEAVAG